MKSRYTNSPRRIALLAGISLLTACDTGRNATRAHDSTTSRPPATSSVSISRTGCDTRELSGSGIGTLQIGVAVDSIRARCSVIRDTTKLGLEGMPARTILVATNRDTVEAEIDNNRVWRIPVTDPDFRTRDSLGVGTPLTRLLAMPDLRGMTGEGALYVMTPARCGLSFQLSESDTGAASGGDWTAAALRRLPSRTTVSRVLIVGCQSSP